MSEVKDVTLQILPSSDSNKRNVTVGFKLAFNPGEAGQQFQYGISLRGAERLNDDEPGDMFSKGELLYTFNFGSIFFNTYKTVTAQSGEQSFSEVREISVIKLNEDPGFTTVLIGLHDEIHIPHDDEVYATVILVADEKSSPVSEFIF